MSGYRNVKDYDLYNPDEPLMFRIRGDDEDHTRAIQVRDFFWIQSTLFYPE